MHSNSTLDDELLTAFMDTFYGFGSYEGRYWLVGMEEAGGETFAAVEGRLRHWQQSGCPELEDLFTHAMSQGWGEKYFGPKPKWQPTWGKLIRLMLATDGQQTITMADVKRFQREQLGRRNGNHCLIELFPLPAPSTGDWLYAECSSLPFLQDRKRYRQHLVASRIKHIRSRLHDFQPKAVVFYGWSYRRWWQEIVKKPLQKSTDPKFLTARSQGTQFFVVDHPTAWGVTNRYFESIGKLIATSGEEL